MMAPTKLVIRDLGKTYRTGRGEVVALAGVDLEVGENEFVALVGTSGCGKSTLLSIVAGLESMDRGIVTIDDEPITAPGLDRGVVFQTYTLLPWLTRKATSPSPSPPHAASPRRCATSPASSSPWSGSTASRRPIRTSFPAA
jgi:predicted ABC-type transport system involved in lysophospholipase L1 biosynthesis ATPase subunit